MNYTSNVQSNMVLVWNVASNLKCCGCREGIKINYNSSSQKIFNMKCNEPYPILRGSQKIGFFDPVILIFTSKEEMLYKRR